MRHLGTESNFFVIVVKAIFFYKLYQQNYLCTFALDIKVIAKLFVITLIWHLIAS